MREPVCLRFGVGFHSGAEMRLAAAVAHLVDLWNMADEPHSRAAIDALRALLTSPIGRNSQDAIRNMVNDQLGHDGTTKLLIELYQDTDDCGCPAGAHEEINRLIAGYDSFLERSKKKT